MRTIILIKDMDLYIIRQDSCEADYFLCLYIKEKTYTLDVISLIMCFFLLQILLKFGFPVIPVMYTKSIEFVYTLSTHVCRAWHGKFLWTSVAPFTNIRTTMKMTLIKLGQEKISEKIKSNNDNVINRLV